MNIKQTDDREKRGSERQREANRRNGKLGAGRKTPRGRKMVGGNALKSGIYSQAIHFLPWEEPEYRRWSGQYHKHYAPQGPTETASVEQIAALAWKIRRLYEFAAESDKVVALSLSADEMFDPTRITLEVYDARWKFTEAHVRCRERLLKLLREEIFHLQLRQARRLELARLGARQAIAHQPSAEAASDRPAEAGAERIDRERD